MGLGCYSSGPATLAARRGSFNPGSGVEERIGEDLLPDSGERSLSKLNSEWQRQHGLMGQVPCYDFNHDAKVTHNLRVPRGPVPQFQEGPVP